MLIHICSKYITQICSLKQNAIFYNSQVCLKLLFFFFPLLIKGYVGQLTLTEMEAGAITISTSVICIKNGKCATLKAYFARNTKTP